MVICIAGQAQFAHSNCPTRRAAVTRMQAAPSRSTGNSTRNALMSLQHSPRRQLTVGLRGATLSLTLLLAVAGCGSDSDSGTEPSPVVAVEITGDPSLELEANTTHQFHATAFDAEGEEVPGASIVWSSSDEDVATVDPQTGIVTGVDRGMVTITASSNGHSDEMTFDVVVL